MKTRTLFILLFLMTYLLSSINAQDRRIKKVIESGKHQDYIYSVQFPNSSMLSSEDLQKWVEKHTSEYYLIGYKTQDVWFAGTNRRLVSEINLVKVGDLSTFNKLQKDKMEQRIAASHRQAERDAMFLGFLGTYFGMVAKATYNQFTKPSSSSSYDSYSSSSSSSSNSYTWEWVGEWRKCELKCDNYRKIKIMKNGSYHDGAETEYEWSNLNKRYIVSADFVGKEVSFYFYPDKNKMEITTLGEHTTYQVFNLDQAVQKTIELAFDKWKKSN